MHIYFQNMRNEFEKFTISQYGLLIRNGQCLILEFSHKPGIWGLPGGRIDRDEAQDEAFRREIKEELGISSFENLGLIDFDARHTSKGDAVCAVSFLIKNDHDELTLSFEHSDTKWISPEEIDQIDFISRNTGRMIQKGFEAYERLTSDENGG